MSNNTNNVVVDDSIHDRLQVLYQQEVRYQTHDYLAALQLPEGNNDSSSSSSSRVLNQHWREVMCEWAYHVIDHFDFPREIVSTCMNLLDRYLAIHLQEHPEGIPKDAFQLLAMTCLYVAIKLDQPRMLSLQTMAHLSRGTFNKEQMQAMEMDLLNKLGWNVHPCTPYTFLSYFMQVLPGNPACVPTYEMARYLVELSVLDYFFVGQRSSTVAIAALLNAVDDYPHYAPHLYKEIALWMVPGEEGMIHQCRGRLRGLSAATSEERLVAASARDDRRSWQASPTSVAATLMT